MNEARWPFEGQRGAEDTDSRLLEIAGQGTAFHSETRQYETPARASCLGCGDSGAPVPSGTRWPRDGPRCASVYAPSRRPWPTLEDWSPPDQSYTDSVINWSGPHVSSPALPLHSFATCSRKPVALLPPSTRSSAPTVGPIATVFFWNIPLLNMPLVVFCYCGATFFTFRMGFVNIRMFRHAIDLVQEVR